jgi:hypothetical protein
MCRDVECHVLHSQGRSWWVVCGGSYSLKRGLPRPLPLRIPLPEQCGPGSLAQQWSREPTRGVHTRHSVRNRQLHTPSVPPFTNITPRPRLKPGHLRGARSAVRNASHLRKELPRALAGHDTVCCTRDNETSVVSLNLPSRAAGTSFLTPSPELSSG